MGYGEIKDVYFSIQIHCTRTIGRSPHEQSLVPVRSRSPAQPTLDPPPSVFLLFMECYTQVTKLNIIVIDPAGDEAPGRMADFASAGFQGVKTTLRLIERAQTYSRR